MGDKEEFMTRVTDLYRFEAIQGHLGWDTGNNNTKGAKARGEILAVGWTAQQTVDDEMGELLSSLEDGDHDDYFSTI